MSTDGDAQAIQETDDVSQGRLVEMVRGLEARVEQLENENDELREAKDDLEERVKKVDGRAASKSTVNLLIGALTDADMDFTADPGQNREALVGFNTRVETMETMLKRHESKMKKLGKGKTNGPDESWLAIIDAADNLSNSQDHGLPNNRVKLYAENISQATGKSERMALNYIEDFGEDKEGATWQPYKPPSEQNGGHAQKKTLIVDLDVWGDEE